MSSIKATRFVCEPPFTPFAPVWDYTIAQTTSDIDLESLAEYILIKEKEIISEYKEDLNDGMTSLGDDSLTARFKYFNVLKWDHPECKKLLDEIAEFHEIYHTNVAPEYTPPKMKVRCWANVLRKGEQITNHNHSIHPHTYLSGHFCVKTEDTATIYYPPYINSADEEIVMQNIPGEMTLFPTWLVHGTSKHEHDEPRITIAFDIVYNTEDVIRHADADNLIDL
jgi:hypothetical protein